MQITAANADNAQRPAVTAARQVDALRRLCHSQRRRQTSRCVAPLAIPETYRRPQRRHRRAKVRVVCRDIRRVYAAARGLIECDIGVRKRRQRRQRRRRPALRRKVRRRPARRVLHRRQRRRH